MGRYRSRSRSLSRSYSPVRRKRHDEPRDRRRERRSPGPSGLLVRNIPLSARPEDLRVPFERYGPIRDVYLPKNYHTGEPRGFGFVKFRYAEDAAEAKAHLNNTVIGGRDIRIVFAEDNRKTPREMCKVLSTSGPSARGSYWRHSSPSRRYHSYSRSASPARRDSRDRDHEKNHDDDYYSPRRSRSQSRSISPRDDRNCRSKGRSSRQSRPMSRSNSPCIQKKGRFISMTPRDNSQIAHDVDSTPRRLKSPGRNGGSSARSPSRSYSR